MRFATSLFAFLLKFGGPGLFVIGVLDSSYLFAPWGNDLLVIALTTQNPHVPNMLYYAAMSTAGSVLGCLLLDVTMRPLGAKGLEKYLSPRRLKNIQKKVGKNVGRGLAIASFAPPPFPFTAFVMAAAALQYSRARLLAIVAVTRAIRFVIIGILALRFGRSIMQWTESPVVQVLLACLIAFCIIGSVVSVYKWIKNSRTARA